MVMNENQKRGGWFIKGLIRCPPFLQRLLGKIFIRSYFEERLLVKDFIEALDKFFSDQYNIANNYTAFLMFTCIFGDGEYFNIFGRYTVIVYHKYSRILKGLFVEFGFSDIKFFQVLLEFYKEIVFNLEFYDYNDRFNYRKGKFY